MTEEETRKEDQPKEAESLKVKTNIKAGGDPEVPGATGDPEVPGFTPSPNF